MNQSTELLNSEQLLDILALTKYPTAIYAGEHLIVQMANERMLSLWNKDKSIVGVPLRKIGTGLPPELLELLAEVWKTGNSYQASGKPFLVNVNGQIESRYLDLDYRALRNEEGKTYCILDTTVDVTEAHRNKASKVLESEPVDLLDEIGLESGETSHGAEYENIYSQHSSEQEQYQEAKAEAEKQYRRIRSLLMQAPAGICILDGPELVFELVNPLYQQLLAGRDLINKPILEALPEIEGEPIWDILQDVYQNGRVFEGKELLVPLARTTGGLIEDRYFNFIYQPRLNQAGEIDGILVFVVEVTDIVLNRQAIEDKEARLRSVIMSAPYGLMILEGRDYVISTVNQQIANLWQKTLPEITGKKLLDVLPEIKDQPFPALLNQVYETGETYEQEEEKLYLHTGDEPIVKYVSFTYEPLWNGKGDVAGIIVACEDVTDRVRSRKLLEESYAEQQALNEELSATNEELSAVNEEILASNEELVRIQERLNLSLQDVEDSENKMRALVASAPFPIGVYEGREMRIALANKSIMDVWGKGYDVIGKRYAQVLPELENQEVFEQLDQVFTTGLPFHRRNQPLDLVVNGHAKQFYFNYSFTPLFDPKGKVYGIMNTAADVTDLAQAKQRVEQSERNLNNIILQAPVAMCIMSGPEYIITVANQAIIDLWGKPVEAVMNKPVFEALPDAREQGLEQLMANVYERGETFHASEMPVELERNGKLETVYQNFVYQPYRDSDGTILGIIAITIDITEQVMARKKIEESEAELRITKERLEAELEAGRQLQRQKDSFIGIASHELKTPLTSLTAIIQVLNAKLRNQGDEFILGAVQRANVQVKRMSGMINGFLNISRLEAGKLVIEKQKFDLMALTREVIDEIKFTVSTHSIDFSLDSALEVVADHDKIGSVISNLVSNAVKYSPNGKRVEVKCTRLDGHAIISVKDEGIGIKPQDVEKIFDRYYRVEGNDTRHISGFGIGLYLSADIVSRHDGKIWVESTFGEGSTFSFSLPIE